MAKKMQETLLNEFFGQEECEEEMEKAWISVYEDIDGAKLRSLYKSLGTSKYEAVGILIMIWLWGIKNANDDGVIPEVDEEDLALALAGHSFGSKLDPRSVVQSLIETGWIEKTEGTFTFPDWGLVQKHWRDSRSKKERDAARYKAKSSGCREDKPADTTSKAIKSPRTEYSAEFEQFWEIYPRKVDKGQAYKKYKARLSSGFRPEELVDAAKNYAFECRRNHTEQKFIKHASTFLGDATPFVEYIKRKVPEIASAVDPSENPFAEYEE